MLFDSRINGELNMSQIGDDRDCHQQLDRG